MKTKEELYAEDILKTFIPKDKKDKIVEHLTISDFNKAREALRKAHVPGPYIAIQSP